MIPQYAQRFDPYMIQQLSVPEEDSYMYMGRNVARVLLYHVCMVIIS